MQKESSQQQNAAAAQQQNQQIQAAQQIAQQQMLQAFWTNQLSTVEQTEPDFKTHTLPIARIKKVMKSDIDVRSLMISAEAPIMFAKACEIFIEELTLRAWMHAEENKRRTIQKSDIATAVSKSDMYDFLIDIVPRDTVDLGKGGVAGNAGIGASNPRPSKSMEEMYSESYAYAYHPMQQEQLYPYHPDQQYQMQLQFQQTHNPDDNSFGSTNPSSGSTNDSNSGRPGDSYDGHHQEQQQQQHSPALHNNAAASSATQQYDRSGPDEVGGLAAINY